ncbi:MAG: hypothetical protein IPH36_05295 [Saprospiraceae bacterium]|nr:hypothetical protein [Saprospiraceae bacterium]
MNSLNFNSKITVISIIVLAVISRLIPHPYNFAPFGAIALFSGALIHNRYAAVLWPCIAACISGVILNNTLYAGMFPDFTWFDYNIFWQCLAYALTTFVGWLTLKGQASAFRLGSAALSSSFIFFIISNFGYWTSGLFYTKDLTGLMACYTSALPFYPASLAGDLLYTGTMFGIYYLVQKRFLLPQSVN